MLLSSGLWIIQPACSPSSVHETDVKAIAENPKQVAAVPKRGTSDRILRLTLQITETGIETLSAVEADGALNRRDRHRQSPTFFRVVTKENRVLFERGFQIQNERRAEFPDETGKLTRFQGPNEPSIVSIVVPISADAQNLQLLRHKRERGEGNQAEARGNSDEDIELIGEVPL
jgi:hypothetical protein